MRWSLPLLFLAGSLVAGCGKKTAPEAAPAGPALTVPRPDGGEADRFARGVTEADLHDWQAAGARGASLRYQTFEFTPDGRWWADAVLQADFEEIECKESGTWRIDSVSDPEHGIVEWQVDKSTCPIGRTGATTRAALTLGKGGVGEVSLR